MDTEIFRVPDRLPDQILRMTEVGCADGVSGIWSHLVFIRFIILFPKNYPAHWRVLLIKPKNERTNQTKLIEFGLIIGSMNVQVDPLVIFFIENLRKRILGKSGGVELARLSTSHGPVCPYPPMPTKLLFVFDVYIKLITLSAFVRIKKELNRLINH